MVPSPEGPAASVLDSEEEVEAENDRRRLRSKSRDADPNEFPADWTAGAEPSPVTEEVPQSSEPRPSSPAADADPVAAEESDEQGDWGAGEEQCETCGLPDCSCPAGSCQCP